jgi:iron complex outermembrane receptor protein
MKSSGLRFVLLCVLPAWVAQPAFSQSTPAAAGATVELPTFSVSSEKADAYRPTDTMSLARIRGLLIDTPVTVNVMTRELLDDLGANSTFEAARYFPGIGNGRGAGTSGGINDRMNFRGFESQTRTVDNFSQTFIPGTATSIDTVEPEYMERVEIVMGPNAILNPTGTPGGSMNVVTKSPLFKDQVVLKAIVGNYSAQKASFDVTGPVKFVGDGRKLAYRLIGTAQDTDTYIPGSFEKWTVGGMLLYRFSPTSQLTLKYFGTDYKAFENASAPNDNGWLVYEPTSIGGAILPDEPQTPGVTYNGRNGVNVNSITTQRNNNVQLLYTGTLFDFISVRLGGQLLWQRNIGDSAFPSSATNSSTFDPVTGQVTAVPAFNPAAVPVVWRFNYNTALLHSFQNDYAANFTPTETTTLQVVTGWAYNHNHNTPSRTGTSPMPSVNLFTHEGEFAPRPDNSTFTYTNRSESEATQAQAYVLGKAGFFSERAFVTGGITRTWVNSAQYTLNPNTGALVPATAPATNPVVLDDSRDNYIGSLLIKPLKNVSVYYTYSTNANLVTFNSGNGISQPLWSEGKQHEYGVKAEFLQQRLAATATYFDMTQTNVTSPNPLANVNPGAAGNILSDNSSKGWELSLVGGVTKHVSVIASYTSMKYRDAFARRVRNVPDQMAGALVRYSFTDGFFNRLSVFGAMSYFGAAPAETITGFAPLAPGATTRVPGQPGFYTAAWTVYNAGAAYTVNDRWSLNLNIDNLTDKKFGWQPASRLTVSPYPGLTWRMTVTVKL